MDSVVSDVAAAAKHELDRPAQVPWPPKCSDDTVWERAAAGADYHAARLGEKPRLINPLDKRAHVAEESIGRLDRSVQAARADDPLECLDSGERDPRGCPHCPGYLDRLLRSPAAGAPARESDLEQDLQRAVERRPVEVGLDEADLRDRIDQAVEIELGIAVQLARDPPHRSWFHELVGEDHAVDAEFTPHPDLAHRRRGHRPGAAVQLALEKLRRHARLSVWGQHEAVLLAVARHQLDVVPQG